MSSSILPWAMLGMSCIAFAAPILPTKPASYSLERRDGPPAIDDPAWCDNQDLSDPDTVSMIWNDWLIGSRLDSFANSLDPANVGWVESLANLALPGQGYTEGNGCGYPGQDCLVNLPSCQEIQANGSPYDYWILLTVKQMQQFFEQSQKILDADAINGILSINDIQSDFAINITGFAGLPSWVTAALDIGSTIAGDALPAGGEAIGLGVTFIEAASDSIASSTSYESADPSDMMLEALRSYFTNTQTALADILLLAVGGAGDYSTLPGQGSCSDGATCQSPIAGFMSDGRYLLQGESLNAMAQSSWPYLQKKLVDVALTGAGYGIIVCSEDYYLLCQAFAGSQTIQTDDGERMMALVAAGPDGWTSADDQVGLVTDKYGIDLSDYFSQSWDCWRAGSPGIDYKNLPGDGSTPLCFYNGTITAGDDSALPS